MNECRRLYAGCGHENEMTQERLHVLWNSYGCLSVAVWSCAIDIGLLDHRIPNATGFERLVERAELRVEQREAAARNTEASGWVERVADSARRADPEIARSAIAAIQSMVAGCQEWLPLEPWWERVGQQPPVRAWRSMLNRNRAICGLPAGGWGEDEDPQP